MRKNHINVNQNLPQDEVDVVIERLKSAKLTQQELANKIGIRRHTISSYITRRTVPSPKVAAHILEVLDVVGRIHN